MYLNVSVFTKSNLQFSDLVFLAAINQTETDWLIENLNDDVYRRFSAFSLRKHIKQKSKVCLLLMVRMEFGMSQDQRGKY